MSIPNEPNDQSYVSATPNDDLVNMISNYHSQDSSNQEQIKFILKKNIQQQMEEELKVMMFNQMKNLEVHNVNDLTEDKKM